MKACLIILCLPVLGVFFKLNVTLALWMTLYYALATVLIVAVDL